MPPTPSDPTTPDPAGPWRRRRSRRVLRRALTGKAVPDPAAAAAVRTLGAAAVALLSGPGSGRATLGPATVAALAGTCPQTPAAAAAWAAALARCAGPGTLGPAARALPPHPPAARAATHRALAGTVELGDLLDLDAAAVLAVLAAGAPVAGMGAADLLTHLTGAALPPQVLAAAPGCPAQSLRQAGAVLSALVAATGPDLVRVVAEAQSAGRLGLPAAAELDVAGAAEELWRRLEADPERVAAVVAAWDERARGTLAALVDGAG